jgi:hypothetical protein
MPVKLLAELAHAPLPRASQDLDDIERIRVLKAHGHIEATVLIWHFGSAPKQATVHAVTAHGRKVLGEVSD